MTNAETSASFPLVIWDLVIGHYIVLATLLYSAILILRLADKTRRCKLPQPKA